MPAAGAGDSAGVQTEGQVRGILGTGHKKDSATRGGQPPRLTTQDFAGEEAETEDWVCL